MAGEKSIDKIQKLISNQKNIRNIATSAHIHHGKCISGDSRILTNNGQIKTARQVFEDASTEGRVYEDNEEHTIFIPKSKIKLFSLNKENGSIEKKEIKYAWRLKGGDTINITLRNGFKISTTPEHKYIVSKEGFEEIEAKELKLGDRIVCPRKLNVESSNEIKKEILIKLSSQNFYINLNEKHAEEFKKRILKHGIKKLSNEIGLSVKEISFYHGIWQNRYNLTDFVKICELFEIDLNKAYDIIESIFYRTGKQRGGNSNPIKLPHNFEDFFYLAGLFIGDGSNKKFIAGKEQLANEAERICNKLGIALIRVERTDRTPELHANLTLACIFNSLFDYPLKKKSHNVSLSEFALGSKKEYLAKLLRGYFDTDGCIGIKEKDNTISISGLSAINFEKEIGFELKEKAEKLRILVSKVSGSIVCDTIKQGNQVMLINKKLADFNSEELACIEIKKIESGFEKVVYDFTIPENHNFIAEGMIIHNTALTDNLLAAAGLMAAKNAGDLEEGMTTWQHADEQERLMTVDAANVS